MINLNDTIESMNQMILQGKGIEAFEKYYHHDVVMQENNNEPTVGKDANRERELQIMKAVQEFHGAEMKGVAIGDNISMVEWGFDVTYLSGPRLKINQVAVQRWKDGKIIHERFYYASN